MNQLKFSNYKPFGNKDHRYQITNVILP